MRPAVEHEFEQSLSAEERRNDCAFKVLESSYRSSKFGGRCEKLLHHKKKERMKTVLTTSVAEPGFFSSQSHNHTSAQFGKV